MKSVATFALAILACVPTMAQFGGGPGRSAQQPQGPSIELELLELEQEVDKSVLKEALILQGRMGMKPSHGTDLENRLMVEEGVVLREFIAKKKEAITARSAELANKRSAPRRGMTAGAGSPSNPQNQVDSQAAYEKLAEAQVETQLLQAQVSLLQTPLDQAVQALAAAELAASNDESARPKADAARKEFEKLKAKYVEHNKRLQVEQQKMQSMQRFGMGSMGSGMR